MKENFEKYNALREQYPVFIYHAYRYEDAPDELSIVYDFEIPGLAEFHPTWHFPKGTVHNYVSRDARARLTAASGNATIERMIFYLGMIELVSYWKTACPKMVIIEAGRLTEESMAWWKEQYFYGLGEFFYTNGIALDAEGFMDIRLSEDAPEIPGVERPISDGNMRNTHACMIPIGGGKDSAVALELLCDQKDHNFCYMINGRGATFETAAAGGYTDEHIIVAKRTLDPEMLRLNAEGYLNGYTPFSAVVAFASILAAYLYGLPYIALSNESSVKESTGLDGAVDHQYSKSHKFEEDFVEYERAHVRSGVYYFSLLRPWSQYQIAAKFASLRKYHKVVRSCNVGSKEDKWCGHCAKCLYVWMILSPFLSQARLTEIFGKNLAEDASLIPILEELTGLAEEKPFECVGSQDEVNTAITETIERLEAGHAGKDAELPVLYQYYKDHALYKEYQGRPNPYRDYFEEDHDVPPFWAERLDPTHLIYRFEA